MPHVTRTSQLPPAALTPSQADKLTDAAANMSVVVSVQTLVDVLQTHTDPVVRNVINMIADDCVIPWAAKLKEQYRSTLAITASDHYDLVLAPGAAIGYSERCDVQIFEAAGVDMKHVEISKVEDSWRASLAQIFTGGTLSMDIHGITYTRTKRDYEGKSVPVSPGDTITIGRNVIHLHAPTEGEHEA